MTSDALKVCENKKVDSSTKNLKKEGGWHPCIAEWFEDYTDYLGNKERILYSAFGRTNLKDFDLYIDSKYGIMRRTYKRIGEVQRYQILPKREALKTFSALICKTADCNYEYWLEYGKIKINKPRRK